jgi:hypothetical protein
MPSWRVHEAIYEKLRAEVEGFVAWTPGLLERIDEIIDVAFEEHDLGRRPDVGSFQRMLRVLWLEFGDVYDPSTGKFLHASYSDKLRVEREILLRPEPGQRCMIYVPDDALALATLHHILDVITDVLLNMYPPVTIDKSDLLFEVVRRSLGHYVEQLKELKTMGGSTFDRVFDWLVAVLKERGQQLHTMLAEYLRSRGLEPGYGPDTLRELLLSYVRERGYYGIIYVNNTPMPTAAAANIVFKDLIEGRAVVLGFSKQRGPYPPVHEGLRATSVKELCEKLQSNLCEGA